MTQREEFEKETGIKFPYPDKVIDQRSAEADYWEQYAIWQEKRSEWVSVEERLPEKSGSYLITYLIGKRKIVCEAEYNNEYKEFSEPYYGQEFGNHIFTTVTHWRPLPTPPDEAKRRRG